MLKLLASYIHQKIEKIKLFEILNIEIKKEIFDMAYEYTSRTSAETTKEQAEMEKKMADARAEAEKEKAKAEKKITETKAEAEKKMAHAKADEKKAMAEAEEKVSEASRKISETGKKLF